MSIRMGLIGIGRMGKVFAQILATSLENVDLVALADPQPQAVAEAAARYGIQSTYADYHELLQRDDISAVVIATPTATHAAVIQAAAQAGKQIFCEKPLAQTLEQCDAATTAAAAANVKLQIGFMRRFDPAYEQAKKRIDAGEIGVPVVFRATSRDPYRTSLEFARRENSGGLILDMGVHDFDLARWLMSSEVVRVSTEGGCLVYPELKEVNDIDNAMINLKFASGALGNINLSRNAVYGYDIRTEVLGSDGGLMIGRLQNTDVLTMTRSGVTHDTIPYFMDRFPEAYTAELRDFVACILEDRPPRITGADARRATAVGIAATRSLDENRPLDL